MKDRYEQSPQPDYSVINRAQSLLARADTTHTVVDGLMGSRLHTVTFGPALDGDAVVDILSQPLQDFLPEFNSRNVIRGLKSTQQVQIFGGDTINRVKAMHSDINGLSEVIKGEVPVLKKGAFATVTKKLDVYTQDTIWPAVKQKMLRLPPHELTALSKELGMEVDEHSLAIRSLMQRYGGPKIRLEHLAEAGVDTYTLGRYVMDNQFYTRSVTNGGNADTVYLRTEQAGDLISKTTKQVLLSKPLDRPESFMPDQEVGSLHDVTYQWMDTTKHLAYALAQWIEQPSTKVFRAPQLVVTGETRQYDPVTNTMHHRSPLLGAAIVANLVQPAVFESSLYRLFGVNQNNLRTHLPPSASGKLPVLLANAALMANLQWAAATNLIVQN